MLYFTTVNYRDSWPSSPSASKPVRGVYGRMANSSFLLADFEATFQICLLRFWKAMNEKRDGERMGVDMLLLDSKSKGYDFDV
ncbi:hypothetical protein Bca52824_065736 [Brassica carinata]|uniref:Uncharacterized protein n=1 Tax=Brassica carinata TaxID=52824 RepID=A0A8X7QJ33_BRACI|nr:hypothetical protein Bca52824_065736 [Brassica carinata]